MGANSSTNSMVIVAIPDENDRVWKIASENVPHLTLLFLGDADKVANPESIMQFVEHAADRSLQRFYLPVDHRGELGADQADVLFFKKGRYDFKAVRNFRSLLLQNQNIKTAYDSTSQFEFPEHVGAAGQPWIPHLTLGYPTSPAKEIPDDQNYQFFDVCFNRVAVWMGDFDGPEFMLKDYWDEMDDLDIPMDAPLAMANANDARKSLGLDAALEHFGVRGMRWGVRNETISVNGKTQQVTKRQAKKADVNWKKDFEKLKNFGFDDQKFTSEYNAKWKDHDFSKEDWSNPSPTYQKYQDGYFNEMSSAYAKQVVEHFGSSPTGKMRVEQVKDSDYVKLIHNPKGVNAIAKGAPGSGTSMFGRKAKHDALEHADGDETIRTFKVIFDDKGLIKGVKPVEDAMSQTEDLGIEFLEHFGVRGMRWGVRNAPSQGGKNAAVKGVAKDAAKKTASGARKVGKGLVTVGKDIAFESTGRKQRLTSEVHATANENFTKHDIPRINEKYKGTKGGTLKGRLKSPLDPNTRAYRSDSRIAYRDRVNEAVKALPGNASGTRKYEIEDYGKTNAQYGWTLRAVDVKKTERTAAHADISDDLPLDAFVVRPVFDDDGFITDIKLTDINPDEEDLAQTADLGAVGSMPLALILEHEDLEHFGVKGMRWGVRNESPVSTETHVDTGILRRRTQVRAKGGEAHPAHVDAVKAAIQKQKLKKSGTDALSTQELRDLANRLQVENQVALLTSSKGKRVVSKQLEEEGKQTLSRGLRKGGQKAAPHVIKKVGKTAATGAVALAL